MSKVSRRDVLRRGLVGAVLPAGWGRLAPLGFPIGLARGDDLAAMPGLIVRSSMPLDAETPVEAFDRFLTPNDLFFVRSHFGPPATELTPWRFEVDGLVDRLVSLSLDDLKNKSANVTIPAVLQCSGNGRAYYQPTIPGVGWDRGAVGNAEWTGVRLADLLNQAGIKPEAAHVQLHGADLPPHPKTPAYFRSIPLARAVALGTIVAHSMNGEPLPRLHGGPLRLIVPGWAGNHWIKWLRKVTVSTAEAPGFYMQTGYKIPKVPTPPGVDLKPADLVPVTTLNVKSLIARPLAGAKLPAGRVEVRGVAWTGDGIVEKVEVTTGPGQPWRMAKLDGPATPGTWRTWTLPWDAPPGHHTLRARATDSLGQTQGETTPWNKSGYLWNGIDHVSCEIC